MENNTYFILSETAGKVTVMNRYTKEAVTRKLDKKGTIVINRVRYAVDEMRDLTESMMQLKKLESQGCKPVNPAEHFFATELEHDTHDLLFYLDMFGLVHVNGLPYNGGHADDRPVRDNAPLMGVVSTSGNVFLGDVEESNLRKLVGVDFIIDRKRIRFEKMEELHAWIGETVTHHYGEIESPVQIGFYFGLSSPHPVFNFYYANEQGIGFRNRNAVTLENVEVMMNQEVFSLARLGQISSALVRPKYNNKRIS